MLRETGAACRCQQNLKSGAFVSSELTKLKNLFQGDSTADSLESSGAQLSRVAAPQRRLLSPSEHTSHPSATLNFSCLGVGVSLLQMLLVSFEASARRRKALSKSVLRVRYLKLVNDYIRKLNGFGAPKDSFESRKLHSLCFWKYRPHLHNVEVVFLNSSFMWHWYFTLPPLG